MNTKLADKLAIGYVVLYAAIIFFFPFDYSAVAGKTLNTLLNTGEVVGKTFHWAGINFAKCFTDLEGLKHFGNVVSGFPYLTGFLKVALLATFGEMLKNRRRTGEWKTPDLLPKFVVWGLYGMLFSLVFALFAKGVEAISGTGLWFGPRPFIYSTASFWEKVLMGFSISFWTNLIFCYPMMLSHEWFNAVIKQRKFVGGSELLASLDSRIWGSFMLKTIVVFWIPAHTVTFSLPPDFRVLMSAILSLALGFILTVKPKAN